MSRLHVTDSPEWTRFFWAIFAISCAVILSSLLGCTQSDEIEIEILAEPGDPTLLQRRINWLLSYWYYAALAIAAWAFFKAFSKMDTLPEQ